LPIEAVRAISDTREQCPVDLSPLRVEVGTLATGDYSVAGLEHVIAIERKSLPDLLGCIGQERERFDREIMRLLAYQVRALVVESTWPEIEAGQWRSKITPAAALGSLLGWGAMGLPIYMVGTHERAGRYIARLLVTAARRRWREARALLAGSLGSAEPKHGRLSPSAYDPATLASFCPTGEGD
jgi:ERCC4-type nuclease